MTCTSEFEAQIANLKIALEQKDVAMQQKDAEIAELKKQLGYSHDERLDEVNEKILKAIIDGNNDEESLSENIGISVQKLCFHIENQLMSTLVERKNIYGIVATYSITAKGRQYCSSHGLI